MKIKRGDSINVREVFTILPKLRLKKSMSLQDQKWETMATYRSQCSPPLKPHPNFTNSLIFFNFFKNHSEGISGHRVNIYLIQQNGTMATYRSQCPPKTMSQLHK